MDAKVNIDVSGVDKLFLNLPRTTQRRAYMPALRAGGFVIRDMAVENVKSVATRGYATGTLEKNIRVYSYKKYRGNFRVGVQIKRGAVNQKKIVNGKPVRIGLYGSVLEYGKKNQAPQSWIRKAIREGKSPSYNAILKEFNKRLIDAVREAQR